MSGDYGYSNSVRGIEHGVENSSTSIAQLNGRALLPNAGIPLDLNWVQEVRVNTSAVERRVQSQVGRRTVKKEWQAAWLLRAITCMDLTTLSGDDTDERVRRLCAKARQPIQHEIVEKLGIEKLRIRWRPPASITLLWRLRDTRSKAVGYAWPRYPLDFRPVSRRSRNGSLRSEVR